MINILLLGKNGQLGWELQRTLAPLGPVTALDYEELDLEDFEAVQQTVREIRPELIVNAAAYTNVDKAESEPEKAYAINATVPGILAEEARALKAILVHYSTDYVFDGTKGSPYAEEDRPNPINTYGKSKLAGEQAVQNAGGFYVIYRTSWVYSLRQGGFVNKVLEWARQQESLRMVTDQVSNPTWCRALAEITALTLARGKGHLRKHAGLYHLAGSGHASRLEWAKSILKFDPNQSEQKVQEILPALTVDFPTPARRPLFSALECSKFAATFGLCLPEWEEALRLATQ